MQLSNWIDRSGSTCFRFPRGGETGNCFFRLHTKPSSIWQPLSPGSMHPKSVHLHWPSAQCKRIKSRFSNHVEGDMAVDSFKARFFRLFQTRICEQKSTPNISNEAMSWIVLPYNICLLLGGLPRTIAGFEFPVSFPFSRARLSWSLGGQHLTHLLRQLGNNPWSQRGGK